MTSQLEANKALVKDLLHKIFVAKDIPAAAELLTDRYIQHAPNMPTGKAGFQQKLPEFHAAYPNFTAEIKNIWAEGDYVIVFSHYRFTPEDRGTASVDIFRIQDGKIDEHWDVAQEIPETAANDNGMF
jgi:predicted SnoaL-like aldol condensation-catalyzing enzyme